MQLFKKGKYYHARFRTQGGKYATITTKCTNIEDARKMVSESKLKEQEMAARVGALSQQTIGRVVSGSKVTMAECLDRYCQWMDSRGRSKKTTYNNRVAILAWLRDMKLGSQPPASITPEHINAWVNKPNRESKVSSRRTELSSIRSFFGYLSANGLCLGDPSSLAEASYENVTHDQKEAKQIRTFTKAEVQKILAHTEGFWKLAVRLSYECGLRLGDICQLEWNCFINQGYVVAWTDKRNRRIAVPISDELVFEISRLGLAHPRYVFPDQATTIKDVKRRALYSTQFRRILDSLGIEGKSFHGLRHTFATNLAKDGKTMKDIQVVMGHASPETTGGYVHE